MQSAAAALEGVGRSIDDVRGPMGNAWLQAEMSPEGAGSRAAAEFHAAEWEIDPTLLQEAAWEMLPAPGRDRIDVGGQDVGALRGFSYPWPMNPSDLPPLWRSGAPGDDTPHRWTRPRSWIRMRSSWLGEVRLTLRMGAPLPYRGEAPTVRVTAFGVARTFQLSAEMKDYSLEGLLDNSSLLVQIDSSPWNHSDQPSEQGVRVEWARVDHR